MGLKKFLVLGPNEDDVLEMRYTIYCVEDFAIEETTDLDVLLVVRHTVGSAGGDARPGSEARAV